MASKRVSHEEGNGDRDPQVPRKRRYGASEQADTRTTAISSRVEEQFKNNFVSLFRKVIREELPAILQRRLSPCCGLSLNVQHTGTSGGRALQLCFVNKPPPKVFTFSEIMAEDGAALQIELRDATYQHRIVKEEASILKIQLRVLDGDFGFNGSDDWTAEEFTANTLSPRKGKQPLLVGDTIITLKHGVGCIPKEIVFTDNSCWTRRGTFRLGVEVVQSTSIGATIREGRSEPIKVLDKRGEAYKKHDRPSLNGEVWRLKKISKGGKIHEQLSSHGIQTIKDLLQLYIVNQASLKQIIGKIQRKAWEAIIEHAKACDIDDDKRYIYTCQAAEQSISLVFNCIYAVVEVSFNGPNFRSLDSLNLDEKRLVERVKLQAYKNLEDLVPLETTHSLVKTLAGVQAAQDGAIDHGLQEFDFPIAQQDQLETWLNLCEPSTSASHIDQATQSDQSHFNQLQELGDMPLSWLAEGQFINNAYSRHTNEWPLSGLDIDQFASYSTPPISMEQVNPIYCPPCGNEAECSNHYSFPNSAVHISSNGKRKTVWNKIRTAFKWVKLHVAKRRANLFHRQY